MSSVPDQPSVVVAGHICLDVIPQFVYRTADVGALIAPGKLVEVGPCIFAAGGVVANTGLALHRLGLPTRLVGKVGDDLFGRAIVQVLRDHHPALAGDMIVAEGEPSSYTLVLSPPGVDRAFFHCPGVNDSFRPDEIGLNRLSGARLFHFGYPPLMRQSYADGGAALAELFRHIRAQGLLVSVDMAMPDPQSAAGRVDWSAWMRRVLPHVDLFGPSLDEIVFMLDRPRYDRVVNRGGSEGLAELVHADLLHDFSDRLLEMGASFVVLKLGKEGLYLRTSDDNAKFDGPAEHLRWDATAWRGRELLHPCFRTEVTGTTGAGDTTLAGFLAGLVHGLLPEEALKAAVAVGACSVERSDATSGVPSWTDVQRRIRAGWRCRDTAAVLPGWKHDVRKGHWRGPRDSAKT